MASDRDYPVKEAASAANSVACDGEVLLGDRAVLSDILNAGHTVRHRAEEALHALRARRVDVTASVWPK